MACRAFYRIMSAPLFMCSRSGLLSVLLLLLSCVTLHGQGFVGNVPDANESPLERAERAREELMVRMQTEVELANAGSETLEGRIIRLKRELADAEAALISRKEAEKAIVAEQVELESGALVVIGSGEAKQGAGFITELRGRTFFVTTIGVLGAARGESIQTRAGVPIDLPPYIFIGRGRDVVIVPIEWEGPILPMSQSLSFDEIAVGQAVTIFENPEKRKLKGVVRHMDADKLNVVGKYSAGSSGSPIVHDELGQVIAVASSYRTRSVSSSSRDGRGLREDRQVRMTETHCYGYRLDGEIEWGQVALADLYLQGEAYARYEDRTRVMGHIGSMLKNQDEPLIKEYRKHDSLGYLYDYFDRDFDWRTGGNTSTDERMMKRFVTSIMSELQTDRVGTQEALTIDYYQRRYLSLENQRDQAAKDFKIFRDKRLD